MAVRNCPHCDKPVTIVALLATPEAARPTIPATSRDVIPMRRSRHRPTGIGRTRSVAIHYDQGLVRSPLAYAVEHGADPGSTLVVTTNQPHLSNGFGTQGSPILPGQVADRNRTALSDGWTPEDPGSPFHLDQSAGFASSH
ncbi:hypothetical protein [Streptomyces griseofuscus]|uniref:hypothetical protein n=1 Tax=Streptomyces griseofuscus TaxID=146922 RepID=UPI00342333EB